MPYLYNQPEAISLFDTWVTTAITRHSRASWSYKPPRVHNQDAYNSPACPHPKSPRSCHCRVLLERYVRPLPSGGSRYPDAGTPWDLDCAPALQFRRRATKSKRSGRQRAVLPVYSVKYTHQFPNNAASSVDTGQLLTERPLFGTLSQSKQAHENVLFRILVREEGLPTPVGTIIPSQEL
jgi:hypothetical protein